MHYDSDDVRPQPAEFYVEQAREILHFRLDSDDFQVPDPDDDSPEILDYGAWVTVRVWVPHPTAAELDDDDEEC